MATGKTTSVPSLYTELNRLGNSGDYERALKTANKILSLAPEELEALQCKLVCLLQLSKFTEALQTINKSAKHAKSLVFEKAYTQYRLNQPAEALVTVDSAGNLDDKLRELKAQILYRLERYEDSYELYRDMVKNISDDYQDEREANLAAVIANLAAEKPDKKLPALRESTYELTYNAACQLVGRTQLPEAEKKLKAAEKLCRETLEEDGEENSPEDIEAELAIVKCQLAYCYQIQGRDKEAQAMYNSILKSKPSDIGLVAVASNNSAALNREQNVFDSKKKMKSATAEGVEFKLSHRQRRNIAFNHCLLTVFTNQAELFKELNKRLVSTYPEMKTEALLLQAVQLFWEGKPGEAADLLQKNPADNLVHFKLTAAHMLLVAGERSEACKILESVLVDSGYKPGIIGSLVTLYMADNRRPDASNVFKNAVEWYKKNQSKGQGDLSALWRQAADFHLRGGEPQVAAHSLEELLRLHPTDSKTLAQLVIAYSNFDPSKAQQLSKKLPPCTLSNMAEVDALETSNWMMGTKVIKKAAKVESSPRPGSGIEKPKLKKKKRKPRLPKNYDPDSKPDPERWLPKQERTGYRHKKRDRRVKEVMKGSQGAATGASELYDMSKMAPKGSPATPNSPAPADGPRQQQKKHQQKKKKGKR